MHIEWSPFMLWIPFWIVNTYSKFQVNIFSNNTYITKCQVFSKSKKRDNSEKNKKKKKKKKKKPLNCPP